MPRRKRLGKNGGGELRELGARSANYLGSKNSKISFLRRLERLRLHPSHFEPHGPELSSGNHGKETFELIHRAVDIYSCEIKA